MRHTQQPRQSRSPTGGVDKPSISSTPSRKGRVKGPQHSYGRGLPVKRKALIILSIAILAFAMIPALGAGAQSAGAVKIVTPGELAGPSGTTGSTFARLQSATYVSSAVGTGDLTDTYGTLYAVIEDNDGTANTHKSYTYYRTVSQNSNVGAIDNSPFNLADGPTNIVRPVVPGATANEIFEGALTLAQIEATASPTPTALTETQRGLLRIADRNRDGVVGPADVTVWGYKDTDNDDSTKNDNVLERIPTSLVQDVASTSVSINLAPPARAEYEKIIIQFVTATTSELRYPDTADAGTNRNQSRVTVESDAGDSIRITASEKDLAWYADDNNVQGGVDTVEFTNDDAVSVDSGTFVGRFGLIPNDWKTMLTDYNTAVVAAKTSETDKNGTALSGSLDDATATVTPSVQITPSDSRYLNGAPAAGLFTAEVWHGGDDSDSDNVIPAAKLTNLAVSITSVVTDENCEGNASVGSTFVCTELKWASGDNEPSASVNLGDVNGDTAGTLVAEVRVSYDTVTGIDALLSHLDSSASGDQTKKQVIEGNTAFSGLCSEDKCAEAGTLRKLLVGQVRNLGTGQTVRPAVLVNQLLGVEDGNDIDVLYADEKPSGTRSASATVDLIKPSVTADAPANGTFTTEDRFDVLFTVIDADSGLPEDADAVQFSTDNKFVDVKAEQREEGASGYAAASVGAKKLDEEEEVTDGFQYEVEIDVNAEARAARDKNKNLEVKMTVTAYDRAGNRADIPITYTVDVIDPELERALTGVGAKLDTTLDPDNYTVVTNDPTWIALVFNGPINGAALIPSQVAIGGQAVDSLLWLDNTGSNKITTKNDDPDLVRDSTGLALDRPGTNQDARHILFVKLDEAMETTDRPGIEIDANDLVDLAGNKTRSDHTISRATDKLAPAISVSLANTLSNSALDVDITSSEEMRRAPTATINVGGTDRRLTVRESSSTSWTISTTRKDIGASAGGVYTISVMGEDDDGNSASKTAKWELDIKANNGKDPTRGGTDAAAETTEKIETNDVIFLNVSFGDEGHDEVEYTGDTKKKISISSLSLETLSADSIDSNDEIVDSPTVDSTTDLDASTAQSRDGIKHVVALSDLALGNYRLQIGYADEAGNTDTFGYVFTITAPAPEKIEVVPGWSLISIPGTPQDKSIAGVLEGSSVTDVWSLNNETKVWEFARMDEEGEWTGTLSQITDGRGYFVRSTTFDPISVLTERFSPQRTPPQYTVTTGWNTIGYTPGGEETMVAVDAYLSSLGTTGWGMIRAWNEDASPPRYETYFSSGTATAGFDMDGGVAVVKAGQGYLLFATRNGVIGG